MSTYVCAREERKSAMLVASVHKRNRSIGNPKRIGAGKSKTATTKPAQVSHRGSNPVLFEISDVAPTSGDAATAANPASQKLPIARPARAVSGSSSKTSLAIAAKDSDVPTATAM